MSKNHKHVYKYKWNSNTGTFEHIFKNLNTGTSKNTGFIKKRYNCGGVSVSQLNKNNRYTKPD